MIGSVESTLIDTSLLDPTSAFTSTVSREFAGIVIVLVTGVAPPRNVYVIVAVAFVALGFCRVSHSWKPDPV